MSVHDGRIKLDPGMWPWTAQSSTMVLGKKWDTLFLVEDTWWLVKSKTTPLVIPVDSACRKASWGLSLGWMCGAKCWLMMRYCACPTLVIWGVEMSWNGLIFRSGGMAMSKLSALLLAKFDMSYCIATLCINSSCLKIFEFFWHCQPPCGFYLAYLLKSTNTKCFFRLRKEILRVVTSTAVLS